MSLSEGLNYRSIQIQAPWQGRGQATGMGVVSASLTRALTLAETVKRLTTTCIVCCCGAPKIAAGGNGDKKKMQP